MSVIQDLLAQWQATGVQLEPPATQRELQSLKAMLKAQLPLGLDDFYQQANGMSDGEYDHHYISFWSITKILEEYHRLESQDSDGVFSALAIGDFLIYSSFIWLRVRRNSVSLFLDGSEEEFLDFTSFVERYINDPDSLPIL